MFIVGQPATYQFKNGKWCCSKNQASCPENRKQISLKTKEKWNATKELGYKQLKDNPNKIDKSINITPHICTYCGEYAEYQFKNGKWCCHPFSAQCPALRKKNSEIIKSMYSEDGKVFNGKLCANKYTKEIRQRQGWSKGLTKYTNQILKEKGKRLSQKYKNGELKPSWSGRTHTSEEIDKIVNGMTHFRIGKTTKGFKHGWYKGFWCDSSWELAFVMYNIDHRY